MECLEAIVFLGAVLGGGPPLHCIEYWIDLVYQHPGCIITLIGFFYCAIYQMTFLKISGVHTTFKQSGIRI